MVKKHRINKAEQSFSAIFNHKMSNTMASSHKNSEHHFEEPIAQGKEDEFYNMVKTSANYYKNPTLMNMYDQAD